MTTFKHRKVQKKRKCIACRFDCSSNPCAVCIFAVSYTKDRSDGNRDADTAGSVRLGKK